MDEKTIISKLQSGEEAGLYSLLEQYSGYVGAILTNLTRGKLPIEDVEELAADVFLAVWRHGDRLDPNRGIKAYLAQTARNAAFGRLRKRQGELFPFDDALLFPGGESPAAQAELREQTGLLNTAVEDFKEPEREIFTRFYFFGESVKAIAARLKLNPVTVRTKLHRCRKRLKTIFSERGYEL